MLDKLKTYDVDGKVLNYTDSMDANSLVCVGVEWV